MAGAEKTNRKAMFPVMALTSGAEPKVCSALSIEVRHGTASVLEVEATVPLLGRAGVYASLAAVAVQWAEVH